MFPFTLCVLLYLTRLHCSHAFIAAILRCGDSPIVDHATIQYNGGTADPAGYNITYICQDGYHIVGPSESIKCTCTGFTNCQLRGILPVCKRDPVCILLPRPPHGHVHYTGHVTAEYSCNKDYVLIGPKTRTCEANGQWSGGEPKCDKVPKPSALRCRACDRVKHLDQCHRIITCLDGEECFTEHVVNNVTRLSVFMSGCRPKKDCSVPSSSISGHEVVNCSECCNDMNAPLGCNSELCSFREHSGGRSTYCLQCELENSVQDCNNITACDNTQMCVSSTVIEGSDHKVTAGCYSAATCLSLIKTLIQSKDSRTVTRTHQRDIIHLCDICCGDDGCNSDTCENVKERMAYLYQQGELDLQTLKFNGTSIPTTYPTTSSSASNGSTLTLTSAGILATMTTNRVVSSPTMIRFIPTLPTTSTPPNAIRRGSDTATGDTAPSPTASPSLLTTRGSISSSAANRPASTF